MEPLSTNTGLGSFLSRLFTHADSRKKVRCFPPGGITHTFFKNLAPGKSLDRELPAQSAEGGNPQIKGPLNKGSVPQAFLGFFDSIKGPLFTPK